MGIAMVLKICVCFAMLLCVSVYTHGQSATLAYIEKYKEAALQTEREYGVPASITLAQGIVESGSGTSILTRKSNNHFGIKRGSWKGPVTYAKDDDPGLSPFRSYSSAYESYIDHAIFLKTNKRYRRLFALSIYDYRGWAHGLKKAGYATATDYAEALIGLIEQYKLYAINGGVKLRQGRTVVITKYETVERPVFLEEDVIPEDEITEEQEVIIEAIQRYVVEINDIHCTVIQPGENLASVSRKYDIGIEELLSYNELATDKQAKVGDIIFLDKKKKKYTGPQDVYVAKGGESLYEVSQSFGIRLEQLAKLNDVSEYILLDKGMRVILK